MDMIPRSGTSAWQKIGNFIEGNPGTCVRSNEITSIKVGKGLKVICWENANYLGKSRVFTEDCANVGPEWNDIISSFRVEAFEGTVQKHDQLKRTVPISQLFAVGSKIIPQHIIFESQGYYRILNVGYKSEYLYTNGNEFKGAYENALKENKKEYTAYVYPGVNHGFHNDTTPRYDKAAAELAWKRTIDFFMAKLK
jgi:hypothetical protein